MLAAIQLIISCFDGNGLPVPSAFSFHAFPPLKPPCLFIFGGPA